MDFLEYYFKNVVLCAGFIYLTLATILLLYKVPQTEYFERYRASKRYLAGALVFVSITIFSWLYAFEGDWDTPNPKIASIDLIYYFLVAILVSYGFGNLLDKNYITKKRIITDLLKWIVSVTCCIISITDSVPHQIQDYCVILSFAVLLEFCLRSIIYFRKIYRRNSKMLENYFTVEAVKFVSWTKKSVTLIGISGLLAIITINEGALINWLYQIYNVSINIYITVSMINYSSMYAKLKEAEPQEKEEMSAQAVAQANDAHASEMSKNMLEKKIKVWASTKSYQHNQFSIEELASLLGTNKYYLSRIINENFHMSFSHWISSLRIADAKEIILSTPDMKLEDIAFKVGFSSSSYFSKVFSQLEGVSPSVWLKMRERNSEGEQP